MMRALQPPAPAALFLAALYVPAFAHERVAQLVQAEFGALLAAGREFDFTFSDYYKPEMGAGLRKAFYVLETLIDPAQLPEWKLRAMALERQYCREGKRTLNLDPGYLEAPKLVLATSKNFAHRVYLGRGVYADVQLYVKDGQFRPNPWTYPDYQTPEHLAFFAQARQLYMVRHKSMTAAPPPSE